MKSYPHIEDYLEVIAGKRDVDLKQISSGIWFTPTKPLISLARYDVGFLESVTDTTIMGGALTDRQAELAVKIILKYQKQLAQHGVDTATASVPKYRKPLRMLDRSKACWIEDNMMVVKFPYDQNLIAEFRDMAKESQGEIKFDRERKVWFAALTEYNVNFVVTWAETRQFDISADLTELQSMIVECEKTPWKIQLTRNAQGELVFQNAESSLIDYIAQQGIEINDSNLITLADLSTVLGYELSNLLWYELEQQVGADLVPLVRSHSYELTGDFEQIERVYRYAKLVNRLPVVIYDPSPTNTLDSYRALWGEDQITVVANNRSVTDTSRPVIWSHRVVRDINPIPLLISHVGLITGAERQIMIQNSHKIIYFNRRLSA
jgi:hypothetical protein